MNITIVVPIDEKILETIATKAVNDAFKAPEGFLNRGGLAHTLINEQVENAIKKINLSKEINEMIAKVVPEVLEVIVKDNIKRVAGKLVASEINKRMFEN